jgi:hypothetical protein
MDGSEVVCPHDHTPSIHLASVAWGSSHYTITNEETRLIGFKFLVDSFYLGEVVVSSSSFEMK